MGPSLCANFRTLIKRGEDTHTRTNSNQSSLLTSNYTLQTFYHSHIPPTYTHTTCLELPTSVTARCTSLRTRSPAPTPRSSRRRRRTASTRARITPTRHRTPVCLPQPCMCCTASVTRY
ncbi:hypothetical protein IG631_03332 [Alternaria alternata]|nr:hypothetical protein IG631_03332 [Alternaria alternata]